MRFLVGLGVGGSVQVTTYYAEFIPNRYRGRCLLLLVVFFSIGGALAAILAIYILLPYGWEWWLAACSLPSMLFVVLCAVFGYCLEWIPRSHYFDLITNNNNNAYKTLKLIAHCNNCSLPEGAITAEPHIHRGRICDLLRPWFKLTSVLLTALWFLTGLSYYSMVLFSAELLVVGSTCRPDVFGDADNKTCEAFVSDDFVDVMLTSFAEIPGLVITSLLIDKIGRKATLISENIVYGVTCLLLFICIEGKIMVFLLFILRSIGLSLLVYTRWSPYLCTLRNSIPQKYEHLVLAWDQCLVALQLCYHRMSRRFLWASRCITGSEFMLESVSYRVLQHSY